LHTAAFERRVGKKQPYPLRRARSGIDASCRLIETDDERRSGTKDRDREASPTNHRLAGDVDTLCIGDL